MPSSDNHYFLYFFTIIFLVLERGQHYPELGSFLIKYTDLVWFQFCIFYIRKMPKPKSYSISFYCSSVVTREEARRMNCEGWVVRFDGVGVRGEGPGRNGQKHRNRFLEAWQMKDAWWGVKGWIVRDYTLSQKMNGEGSRVELWGTIHCPKRIRFSAI